MTTEEINQKITAHQNLHDGYVQSKSVKEQELANLKKVKSEFKRLQTKFHTKQSARVAGLRKLKNRGISLKSVQSYASGMRTLLTGTEYQNVDDGLTEAKRKVQRKINSCESDIDTLRTNISYEKGQVTYWKNQLPYADDYVAS